MKIGELASRTRLAPSAIRFYESLGLLPAVERASNGYRIYGEDAVRRLHIISLSQSFGLTLDSLRQIFDDGKGFSKDLMLSQLSERAGQIDDLIEMLTEQRRELSEVVDTLRTSWQVGQCVEPGFLERYSPRHAALREPTRRAEKSSGTS